MSAETRPVNETVRTMRLPEMDDTGQPGGRFVKRAVSMTLGMLATVLVSALVVSILVRMDVTVKATGVLEPMRIWSARSLVGGAVAEVLVRTGDTVQAGQVLVRLDALGLEAQLAQLEAQLRAAETEIARSVAGAPLERRQADERLQGAQNRLNTARASLLQRMVEHGFGTNVDSLLAVHRPGAHVALDQAVGEVRAAQTEIRLNATEGEMLTLRTFDLRRSAAEMDRLTAQIDEIRERIARSSITAPGAGVVLTESIDRLAGHFVREGETLLEVAERNDWRVTMGIPERDLNKIELGDPVRFEIRAFSERDRRQLGGRVVHVASEAGSSEGSAAGGGGPAGGAPVGAGMYRVVAEFDPETLDDSTLDRLRRGYSVEVNIITRSGRIAQLGWYYLMERLNRT